MSHAIPSNPSASFAVPHNPQVLVAEDDPEMRRLIELALSRDGYDIVSVGSGLQLFDSLRIAHQQGNRPDLVVSDIRMPGMTGLQVLAKMRSWEWNMPVLLITAFGDEETLDDAMRFGNTMVFSKPFDLDDLRTAVMCLLEPHDGYQPVRLRAPLGAPDAH